MFPAHCPRMFRAPALVLASLLITASAFASGPYTIGSSNTVTADFTVTRPSTTPCVVQLLNNAEFDNFNPATFTVTIAHP